MNKIITARNTRIEQRRDGVSLYHHQWELAQFKNGHLRVRTTGEVDNQTLTRVRQFAKWIGARFTIHRRSGEQLEAVCRETGKTLKAAVLGDSSNLLVVPV